MSEHTRRHFIGLASATAVLLAAEPSKAAGAPLPTRALGKTGVAVSMLGLGGHHLGTMPSESDAVRLVHEAIDNGLTFMDSAWEYHDGKSELWLGSALKGRRDQAFVMTKVCTHGRDRRTAMEQLETSLRRLQVDHIDLWQVHEVAWDDDPKNHYRPGGVLEALAQAKKDGKVRFVGFTGHKKPELHLEMLSGGFAFDTVQMPLNPFDGTHKSFEQRVLPEVVSRGMAAIGMKSLSGNGQAVKAGFVTAEECMRYVLSLPIATLVSGIESLPILRQNLQIARSFTPMTPAQMKTLRERVKGYAAQGTYEAYKETRGYDGPIGRAQHDVGPKKEG